jgi:hypothetical protein
MFESNDHKDAPTDQAALMPWNVLLKKVEQEALNVADMVMGDTVLVDSIMMATSSYMTQRDKLDKLRDQFATADLFCRELRNKANELMSSLGDSGNWGLSELEPVDADLAESIRQAAENAANVNKTRADIQKLADQLLDRVLEEIALCSSIVVLRQPDHYDSEGEAFCVAYAATYVIRERAIEDMPASKAMSTLTDWLKFSSGTKRRALEPDFYARNKIAAGIGSGMGLMTSAALRIALMETLNRMQAPPPD